MDLLESAAFAERSPIRWMPLAPLGAEFRYACIASDGANGAVSRTAPRRVPTGQDTAEAVGSHRTVLLAVTIGLDLIGTQKGSSS